jgi:hypothetical protein
MVGIPRLIFKTPEGPEFKFDGKASSATQLSATFCKAYHRANDILKNKLLMGLTDEELGVSLDFSDVVDKLGDETPGYGFLRNSKIRKGMETMKAFLDHPKTKGHFMINTGTQQRFKPVPCLPYLKHAEEFKELIYLLIHCLAGMPKRGSEERRYKIYNILERIRNLFRMLGRLAIIGNYSKTTALSEYDRATLHFIPECIAKLIIRYFSLVAGVENIFVGEFCPGKKDNYQCYLFSSFGKRWRKEKLTTILRRETGYGLAQLRHILPGLVEHYQLDAAIRLGQVSPGHRQQAHGPDVGGRIYSRTMDTHSKLTNPIIHDALYLCDRWEGLMGFSTDDPTVMSGRDMYIYAQGAAYQQESELAKATRSLLSLFTTSLGGTDNDRVHQQLMQLRDILRLEPERLILDNSILPNSHPEPEQSQEHDLRTIRSITDSTVVNAVSAPFDADRDDSIAIDVQSDHMVPTEDLDINWEPIPLQDAPYLSLAPASSPNRSSPKDQQSIFPTPVGLVDLRSQHDAPSDTSALPVGQTDFDYGLSGPSFGGLLGLHPRPKGSVMVLLDVAVR